MTKSFTLGVVASPFGLKGFVKVKSFSGEIAHLALLKNVFLRHQNTEKKFIIEETAPCPIKKGQNESSMILMKFEGIDSPEAAKELAGTELIGDRSLAAPLKQGEYYVEDLKGLEVISADTAGAAEVLGRIISMTEGGGGDMAEVKLLNGEIKLVPFRNEFLGEVDLQNGRIELLKRWILD